jgi:hypothetical protein
MCALLPSTPRAQAYVFKTDRAKIRPLLHAARCRTALELRQKCALPNGETKGQREDGPHFRLRVSRWLLSDVQASRRLTAHPHRASYFRL